MRRLICEHPDGRRVAVDADAFDDPRRNPFNAPTMVHDLDAVTGATSSHHQDGRPADDHRSLKAEGFVPTHELGPDGNERPLDLGED